MKIINVTGNYGKTIFCYYLARQLTGLGAKVTVVSANPLHPAAALLFSEQKGLKEKSLGKVLSFAVLSKQDLFDNLMILDDNLAYLSYAPNENADHYREVLPPDVKQMLFALDFSDYVIIDGCAYKDPISRAAEDLFDTLPVCVISADKKGLITFSQMAREDAAAVVVQSSSYNPVSDVLSGLHDPILLPHAKALEAVYNTEDITSIPPPKAYSKQLNAFIKRWLL